MLKVCGGDVELGNFLVARDPGRPSGHIAAKLLLAEIAGIPESSWSTRDWTSTTSRSGARCTNEESRWDDLDAGDDHSSSAKSLSKNQKGDLRSAVLAGSETRAEPSSWIGSKYYCSGGSQDWGRKYLASNGGCAYIDLDHLELCLPEVSSAHDYVAAWHAMLIIARQAMDAANAKLAPRARVQVLANNSDGQDHSYGGHLNFLISRRTWDDIFRRKPHKMAYLASYEASSIVFTGQGKVGAENGAPHAAYQLSQRADFFETMTGAQTTHRRPLVNSRDEDLCGELGYSDGQGNEGKLARLHCIFFDTNLCHVANLLKCGVTQIMLAMLERSQINPLRILDDPLDAVIAFSHDPSLQARAAMASGKRLTAVELQLEFCDDAEGFFQRGGCDQAAPRAGEILALYRDTLEKLHRGELDALSGRLDWVLKLSMLQRALAQRPQLCWSSPEIKHLDHLYSSLDPAEGLYWSCEKAGLIERVVSPDDVERFVHEPPEDTRAYTRAMLLRLAGPGQISRVDWDRIRFKLADRSARSSRHTIELADPRGFGKAAVGELFESGLTLEEVLDALATDTKPPRASSFDCLTPPASSDEPAKVPLLPAPRRASGDAAETIAAVSDQETVQNSSPREEGGQNHAISRTDERTVGKLASDSAE